MLGQCLRCCIAQARQAIKVKSDGDIYVSGGTRRLLRLSATIVGQVFPVELPTGFASLGVVMVDGQPRFIFGNEDGRPVTASQLTGLEVFATGDIAAANWTRLDNALQLVAGRVQIVDPDASQGIRFYQVRRIAGTGGSAAP